jgi:hypothetical protein
MPHGGRPLRAKNLETVQPLGAVPLVQGVNVNYRPFASAAIEDLLYVSRLPRLVSSLSVALLYGAALTPMLAWLGKSHGGEGVFRMLLCVGFALAWARAFHRSLDKSLGVLASLALVTASLLMTFRWGVLGFFGALLSSPIWLAFVMAAAAPFYLTEHWFARNRAQRTRSIGGSAAAVSWTHTELIVRGGVLTVCGLLVVVALDATQHTQSCSCAFCLAHAGTPMLEVNVLAKALALVGTGLAVALMLVPLYRERRAAQVFKALRDGQIAGWELRSHPLGYELRSDAQVLSRLPYRCDLSERESLHAILDVSGTLLTVPSGCSDA